MEWLAPRHAVRDGVGPGRGIGIVVVELVREDAVKERNGLVGEVLPREVSYGAVPEIAPAEDARGRYGKRCESSEVHYVYSQIPWKEEATASGWAAQSYYPYSPRSAPLQRRRQT